MEEAAKNKGIRDKAFAAGKTAYAAMDYEEAVKQFQIVTVADPKQDVAFANLGNSYHQLKKEEEAAAAYEKAIQLKPMEAAYHNNLGLALGASKKLDEAKAAFEMAATLDPMKAGDYLFNEGAMYNNNNDYPKAIEAFKKTLDKDPNEQERDASDCAFLHGHRSHDASGRADPGEVPDAQAHRGGCRSGKCVP